VAAIRSIAEKSGVASETLRKWVREAERNEGRRPGLKTDERERLCDLQNEVKELRRANEILKAASACSGRVGIGSYQESACIARSTCWWDNSRSKTPTRERGTSSLRQ
jgi:transposase-like protein